MSYLVDIDFITILRFVKLTLLKYTSLFQWVTLNKAFGTKRRCTQLKHVNVCTNYKRNHSKDRDFRFSTNLSSETHILFCLADNIPSSLWLDRVLDDQSAQRLLALRHVPHAVHADSARCSVSRLVDRCWHLCPGNFKK